MASPFHLPDSGIHPKYYSENAEAQQWLKDRQPALTSKDLGRDEDGASVLLRKLDEVDRNLDNFQTTVKQLDAQKKKLIDQKNSYAAGRCTSAFLFIVIICFR
jgi:DNA invertase Pin-like site-specific DNA recombinase